MNKIILKGLITNIKPSHKIKDIEYDQADLIVPRKDGKEDIIALKFKKFSNRYSSDTSVELTGNVRSYSQKLDSGKNKVSLYVFTSLPYGSLVILYFFLLKSIIITYIEYFSTLLVFKFIRLTNLSPFSSIPRLSNK